MPGSSTLSCRSEMPAARAFSRGLAQHVLFQPFQVPLSPIPVLTRFRRDAVR